MVFIYSHLLGCNNTCYVRWLPVCWGNILPAPQGQKRANLNSGLHMAGVITVTNFYPLQFVHSRFYFWSTIPVSEWSNLITQLHSEDRASICVKNINTHYHTTRCHNSEDALYVHCNEYLNILGMILCHNYYIMLQQCQTAVTVTPTNNIIGNSAPAYHTCCII
jgi:hypothetical protein